LDLHCVLATNSLRQSLRLTLQHLAFGLHCKPRPAVEISIQIAYLAAKNRRGALPDTFPDSDNLSGSETRGSGGSEGGAAQWDRLIATRALSPPLNAASHGISWVEKPSTSSSSTSAASLASASAFLLAALSTAAAAALLRGGILSLRSTPPEIEFKLSPTEHFGSKV